MKKRNTKDTAAAQVAPRKPSLATAAPPRIQKSPTGAEQGTAPAAGKSEPAKDIRPAAEWLAIDAVCTPEERSRFCRLFREEWKPCRLAPHIWHLLKRLCTAEEMTALLSGQWQPAARTAREWLWLKRDCTPEEWQAVLQGGPLPPALEPMPEPLQCLRVAAEWLAENDPPRRRKLLRDCLAQWGARLPKFARETLECCGEPDTPSAGYKAVLKAQTANMKKQAKTLAACRRLSEALRGGEVGKLRKESARWKKAIAAA